MSSSSLIAISATDWRDEPREINVVIDLKKLVETKRVIPGDPRKSKVFKRLISEDNPMPPSLTTRTSLPTPNPFRGQARRK